MIEEYELIINGRPKYISKRLLTRDDLIEFAGFDYRDANAAHLVVRWRSDNDAIGGELDDDTTFKVIEGARFNVFYPPAEPEDRGPITITVLGKAASGKTTLIHTLANQLCILGLSNIIVDWGLDGNPFRSNAQNMEALASLVQRNPQIMLREMQAARSAHGK